MLRLLLAFLVSSCAAVTLQWDAAPAEDHVVAYRVYVQAKGGTWTPLAETATPSYTYEEEDGNWMWAVTAVNRDGLESVRSAPVSTAGFLSAPSVTLDVATLRYSVRFPNLSAAVLWRIETSTDLVTWNPLLTGYTITVDFPAGGSHFFRAVAQP